MSARNRSKLGLVAFLSLGLTMGAFGLAAADDAPPPAPVTAGGPPAGPWRQGHGDDRFDEAGRAARAGVRMAERFAQLDTNGDGALSLAEFKAGKLGGDHRGARGDHRRGQGRPGMADGRGKLGHGARGHGDHGGRGRGGHGGRGRGGPDGRGPGGG